PALLPPTLAPPPSPFPYTTLFRSSAHVLLERSVQIVNLFLHSPNGLSRALHVGCFFAVTARRPRRRRGSVQRRHEAADVERAGRSEEHTSELQSRVDLVCRLLLAK